MKRIFLLLLVAGCGLLAMGQPTKAVPFAPSLQQYIAAASRPDSTDLVVSWRGSGPLPQSWRILRRYGAIVNIRVPARQLPLLQAEPRILFAGLSQKPREELATGSLDISVNKLNTAHALFQNITGAGQRIAIKEQRFDTADIDYRNRVVATGLEAAGSSTHAALMATIAAGAANSAEEAMGAAPGALLGSVSFESLLPDPDSVMQAQGLFIQNHSYGTVVENYYGLEAVAFDAQVFALPQLLHVFSAGNSGLAAGAGPYQNIAGKANLTGNFKWAKNVLTVGALDSFARVAPQSSKGPAFDGRVKPELMAFGADGSSGAAALVSGTAALLQQAYKEQTGALPTAAFLKAVLVGSAFDVGAPGVDYASGWGAVDALAALQMIAQKQYATVTVTGGAQQTIAVQVPANIKRLKVTVSWTDGPAAPNASKALLNDVDLVVRQPATGRVWLPWVLNPHRDSLSQPATRGVDTLNNTEQVWIDNPQPGKYHLVVKGTLIREGVQEASVVWQMDTANTFLFTYPTGTDRLEAGQNQLIRWQTSVQGKGRLQVAYDNSGWQTVGPEVNLAQHYMYWQAPDTAATFRLRMLLPNNATVTSARFVVSRQVPLSVGFRCADSILLNWQRKYDRAFEVYVLSGTAMQPLAATTDSFVIVRTPAGAVPVYSVSAVVEGLPGRRSFALNADASGVGCYFKSFYVQQQNAQSAVLLAELGTGYNLASVRLQKKIGGVYKDIAAQTPVQLSVLFEDSALTSGYNFYRVLALLKNGTEITGDSLLLFHFNNRPVAAFPNPVRRGAVLNLQSELPGKYTVWVYDQNGRMVYHKRMEEVTNAIRVQWPAGMYFLRIGSSDGVWGTTKLVVY